jgi:hypothetical protein
MDRSARDCRSGCLLREYEPASRADARTIASLYFFEYIDQRDTREVPNPGDSCSGVVATTSRHAFADLLQCFFRHPRGPEGVLPPKE